MADQFVDSWYYDYGKASSYKSLQQGSVEVTAHFTEEGVQSYYCGMDANGSGGAKLTSDATQTGVVLNVRLPNFK